MPAASCIYCQLIGARALVTSSALRAFAETLLSRLSSLQDTKASDTKASGEHASSIQRRADCNITLGAVYISPPHTSRVLLPLHRAR